MQEEPIVLINSFEVPATDEDAFLRNWERARDFLMTQSGYRSSRLHRSVRPDADFRFVNVAARDSEDAFRAAVASPQFRDLATPYRFHASLYEVVRADERWDESAGSALSREPRRPAPASSTASA